MGLLAHRPAPPPPCGAEVRRAPEPQGPGGSPTDGDSRCRSGLVLGLGHRRGRLRDVDRGVGGRACGPDGVVAVRGAAPSVPGTRSGLDPRAAAVGRRRGRSAFLTGEIGSNGTLSGPRRTLGAADFAPDACRLGPGEGGGERTTSFAIGDRAHVLAPARKAVWPGGVKRVNRGLPGLHLRGVPCPHPD